MTPKEYLQLNPQDARIRRRWLITTIVSCTIIPAFFLLALSIFAIVNLIALQTQAGTFFLTIASLYCIFFLPSLWILIHCAYKKFGVRLLFLSIIYTSIYIANILHAASKTEWNLGAYLVAGFLVAVNLLYFELSLKMLRINKRILFEKSNESQSIKELISSKAQNPEELESVYEDLVCRWPQHKSAIKSLVAERRKLLQCKENSIRAAIDKPTD